MRKRQPIVIKGGFLSDDEVARMLGISRRRQKELDRITEEYFREQRQHLSKWNTPRKGRDDRKRPRAR